MGIQAWTEATYSVRSGLQAYKRPEMSLQYARDWCRVSCAYVRFSLMLNASLLYYLFLLCSRALTSALSRSYGGGQTSFSCRRENTTICGDKLLKSFERYKFCLTKHQYSVSSMVCISLSLN